MNKKWWGLLAIMPALAMVFVDISVLPVALPSIQEHLGASSLQLQWCINAYLLITAILVLAGGKLGDWMGHRTAFSLGMAVFAGASALCGMASNPFWLITARSIQGVGGALMIPASTALLMSLFPPSERGKATGINVSIGSLFMILGPLIGGYLTENLSWRWIFWINLPIALVGLLLAFLLIPRSVSRRPNFDTPGFIYIDSSMILLMIGLVAFGCGIPLVLTPSYASAMGAIPPSKAGSAFGTIATIRSLSATLGVAILGALMDGLQIKSLNHLSQANRLTQDLPPTILKEMVTGSSSQILSRLPTPQSKLLALFYRESQLTSFLIAHWTLAALLVIVFALVLILYNRKSKHRPPETPAEGWD